MSLKIALIGQAAFADTVLSELHSKGHRIVHVFAPPDAPGGNPDPLKARAMELGLPLSQPSSFKGDAAFEHFKALNADLAILAFVTIIVPERILYSPRLKSICFHPSLLPRHRGASAINWTLIHGDKETGVTVFWPDKGIDTGPIIIQKRVPIADDDTTGSIYFNKLFPLGVEAIVESVDLIEAGKAPALVQDESQATYEPPCRDQHAAIDFTKPAREVFNLVRGCDPQPGAYASVEGAKIRLYAPGLESGPAGEPGAVLSIEETGMRIALNGGVLRIGQVRLDTEAKKHTPTALQERGVLRTGSHFGS